jgi:hypothetical protein
MLDTTARHRVARGARWLDRHYGPEWDVRIRRPISLDDSNGCVWGQVYGNWYDLPYLQRVMHGLLRGADSWTGNRYGQEQLVQAWYAEIRRRRAERAAGRSARYGVDARGRKSKRLAA